MRKLFCLLLIALLLVGCTAPAAATDAASGAETEPEAAEPDASEIADGLSGTPFSLGGTTYVLWRGVRCEGDVTEVQVLQIGDSFPIQFTLSGSGSLEPTSGIDMRLNADSGTVHTDNIGFAATDEVAGYDGSITFRFSLSADAMPDTAVLFLTTGGQEAAELSLSDLYFVDEADIRTPAPTEEAAAEEPTPEPVSAPMIVTSDGIQDGALGLAYGDDGSQFTDDGIPSRSMPLYVENIPAGTVCLAVTVTDPDGGDWVHWLATDFDVAPAYTELLISENASIEWADVIVQGRNDFGFVGYGGPTPPSGVHTYVITVYALSAFLTPEEGFTLADLLSAMDGKVLATAGVTGTYAH